MNKIAFGLIGHIFCCILKHAIQIEPILLLRNSMQIRDILGKNYHFIFYDFVKKIKSVSPFTNKSSRKFYDVLMNHLDFVIYSKRKQPQMLFIRKKLEIFVEIMMHLGWTERCFQLTFVIKFRSRSDCAKLDNSFKIHAKNVEKFPSFTNSVKNLSLILFGL